MSSRFTILLTTASVSIILIAGCAVETPPAPIVGGAVATAQQTPEIADGDVAGGADEVLQPAEAEAIEQSLLQQAQAMLGQATDSAESIGDARDWLSERFNEASDATGRTADESAKQVTALYQSLKEQGLTTATSASEWMREDWSNVDRWQYKVVQIYVTDPPAMEQRLNDMGTENWECFNTIVTGDKSVFFFKRQHPSYLRAMPLREVMTLFPIMKAVDGSAE